MMKIDKTWLAIIFIIICAYALRMWHIDTESIWHDEGWSIRAIRGPFTTPDDNTPYAYYFTGHLLWKLGAGESALALRNVSVLIGTLTAAYAIRIGKRWTGYTGALGVGLLVATSPLLWDYAQEVRGYVPIPLIALMMLGGADAILRHGKGAIIPKRVWTFVFFTELLGIYTHNLAVPLVIWLNMAVGVVWLLRRDWQHIITWAGIQIALIISYIPWLLTQSPSGTLLNSPPEIGLPLVRDIWLSYFLPILPQLQDNVLNPYIVVYGLIVFGAGIGFGIYHYAIKTGGSRTTHYLEGKSSPLSTLERGFRGEVFWLLISNAFGVPIFSTALILVAHIDFHPRYYIASVSGTLLLMVFMIVGGKMGVSRTAPTHPVGMVREPSAMQKITLLIVILPALIFSAISLHQITTTRGYQHDDFQGIAEYYATLPEETVILVPFNTERALQDYFASALPIKAEFINIPLYSDDNIAIQTINNLDNRPVEFLTWFQLPADVRGMYPCLLTAASTQVGDAQTYYGLQTQQFTLTQPVEWTDIAVSPRYEAVELLSASYAESDEGVCVKLEWQLKQETDEPIRVAASLLNPFGEPMSAPFGRSDVDISDPQNVTTDNWSVGDIGQTYHLLKIADNAPLDSYDLSINVYTDSQMTGFDLLDEAGNPAGKDYIIEDAINSTGSPQTVYHESTFISDNIDGDTIETGQTLEVELIVVGNEPYYAMNSVDVTLAGEDWSIEDRAYGTSFGTRSWHRFVIPSGNSGEAILSVDGVEIARYQVVDVPRVFDAPDYEYEVGISFPDVATLVGVNVDTELSLDAPPQITLIWQAHEQQTDIAYTVFVQLLSEDGRVVAQSDQQPHRPTIGWVEGEYITDDHTLNINIPDYSGPVALVAGFYDADDGFRRVLTEAGLDYAEVDVEIVAK